MLLASFEAPATAGQSPAPATTARQQPALQFSPSEFGTYVEQARQSWKVPGLAVAVVRGDRTLLLEGYGEAHIGTGRKVDARTVFNIGSVTKSFTSAMIGTLAAEKKLALSDKVTAHLPGVLAGEWSDQITIADLLSHRSGLATANHSILGDVSRDEMLQRLRYLPRATGFRTNFVYNNFGYVAAAAAAEKVTGQSWDALIEDRLFKPSGMVDAVTSTAQQMKLRNRAMPHGDIAGRATSIEPAPLRMVGPAGTIGVSIRDLARWVRLHLSNGTLDGRQVLAPETVRAMQAPYIFQPVSEASKTMWPSTHFKAYGLGWFLRDYRGVKLVEHGGNTMGFTTHVAFVPELDFGIAILSNMDGAPLPTALVYRAVDMALGAPPRDWGGEMMAANSAPTRGTKLPGPPVRPALPLEDYVGLYQSPLYGEVRVGKKGNILVLHLTDQLTGNLTATGENSFTVKWRHPYFAAVGSGGPFTFEPGSDGKPRTLLFGIPGENVLYTRVTGSTKTAPEPVPAARLPLNR